MMDKYMQRMRNVQQQVAPSPKFQVMPEFSDSVQESRSGGPICERPKPFFRLPGGRYPSQDYPILIVQIWQKKEVATQNRIFKKGHYPKQTSALGPRPRTEAPPGAVRSTEK